MKNWNVVIRRTLNVQFSGPDTEEEAKELAWNDAIEKGIIKQEEIDDNQWEIEITEGILLSWRED